MTVTYCNWGNAKWLWYIPRDIQVELAQAKEEGRDISSLEEEFNIISNLDLDTIENQRRFGALLDAVQNLPMVKGIHT